MRIISSYTCILNNSGRLYSEITFNSEIIVISCGSYIYYTYEHPTVVNLCRGPPLLMYILPVSASNSDLYSSGGSAYLCLLTFSILICKMKVDSACYIFLFLTILLICVHFYKLEYPIQKHIVPDELGWLKFKIDLNKLIPV